MIDRKPGWAKVGNAGKCAECGKACFHNRKDAKRFAKARFPGEQVSAYRCGNYWHIGHTPNLIRHRGREAFEKAKSA